MKSIFITGDKKIYTKVVTEEDRAIFHGEVLHNVCSTFSMARDFEWSSRLFFLEMKEDDEEGVGTFVNIEHKSPAFAGEEITFVATIDSLNGNELICRIEASVSGRLIATGKTGQKMFKKERLKEIFTKRNGSL